MENGSCRDRRSCDRPGIFQTFFHREFFLKFFPEIFPEDCTRAGIFPATGSIVLGPGIFFCRDFLLPDLHRDLDILHLSRVLAGGYRLWGRLSPS